MDRDTLDKLLENLVDTLAAIEHERWCHWQRYMHSKGKRERDGSLTLPAELVSRWEHQISTPFSQLTEAEKDSDREQVRRYLPVISQSILDQSE